MSVMGDGRSTTLTQVPNQSSMAINLVRSDEALILEDTSYLNFLKKNGVVIDWTMATFELGLDAEIRDAGAKVFAASAIRAWRDAWTLNAIPTIHEHPGLKPEAIVSALLDSWKSLVVSLVK